MTKEALVAKIKHIIKAQKRIHMDWNGRPDCKNCSLIEDIEELLKNVDYDDWEKYEF